MKGNLLYSSGFSPISSSLAKCSAVPATLSLKPLSKGQEGTIVIKLDRNMYFCSKLLKDVDLVSKPILLQQPSVQPMLAEPLPYTVELIPGLSAVCNKSVVILR